MEADVYYQGTKFATSSGFCNLSLSQNDSIGLLDSEIYNIDEENLMRMDKKFDQRVLAKIRLKLCDRLITKL